MRGGADLEAPMLELEAAAGDERGSPVHHYGVVVGRFRHEVVTDRVFILSKLFKQTVQHVVPQLLATLRVESALVPKSRTVSI